MSGKRPATTELNHENWDQDDPSEHEEMGSFKTATKDILEKRVIRTAKRRSQLSGDEVITFVLFRILMLQNVPLHMLFPLSVFDALYMQTVFILLQSKNSTIYHISSAGMWDS